MRKSEISNEALRILASGVWFENLKHFVLQSGKVDRKLYLEVNKVLENFGGKWNRKSQAHVFDSNPIDKIEDAIATGNYTRLDKNGFFPTPMLLAERMADMFQEVSYTEAADLSCGNGNLAVAFVMAKFASYFTLVEPNADLLKKAVERLAPYYDVHPFTFNMTFEDFLIDNEAEPPIFNAIIMNPPFENGLDAKHITMAIDLLAPNGELVAIASYGLLFRNDRKYKSLREFLQSNGGTIEELPEQSFKESGTMVRTVLIYYKNTKED